MKQALGMAILLAAIGTFFQAYGFSIDGIKPNLALISIAVGSLLVTRIEEGMLIVALTTGILKFAPSPGKDLMVFASIGVGIILLRKFLPWHNSINIIGIISLGTTAFYALLAPHLITQSLFIKEIIINNVIGIILFVITTNLWHNEGNNSRAR